MRQAAEQLTPQLLNERGLAEWSRCLRLPPDERLAELERLQILLQNLQAVSLIEAHHCRGFFGSLTVGRGKTLISWLIPLMFPGVYPAVLFLPGGLKGKKDDDLGKTEIEFQQIRKYWKTPEFPVQLVGYEWFGRKEQLDYLCTCPQCTGNPYSNPRGGLQPKIVIADECDMLKDANSGRSKRLLRYLANHPDVVFIAMTGTMMRQSLKDFAHLIVAAHKERSPLPLPWHVREAWCQALDKNPPGGIRRHPGALLRLAPHPPADDNPDSPLTCAREGVYLRLAQTPGIIIDTEQSCNTPITIRVLKPPDDPVLEKVFYNFRADSKTPDDHDVSDNFSKARVGMELATGFYHRWNPRPPQEWIDARRAYHKLLREWIAEASRRGLRLDTEGAAAAHLKNHPTVLEWQRIKPIFDPDEHSEAVWMSMSVVTYAADWMRRNGPALIWTQNIPVGEMLETLTGVPYYGSAGRDRRGNLLDNADPSKHAIVSVDANMRGRNLQKWNLLLVISPPQPETEWEQGILGRVHRKGQMKPVHADVIVSSADALYALEKACEGARFVLEQQKFKQKILLATWDWSLFPAHELMQLNETDPRRPRWNRGAGRQPELLCA